MHDEKESMLKEKVTQEGNVFSFFLMIFLFFISFFPASKFIAHAELFCKENQMTDYNWQQIFRLKLKIIILELRLTFSVTNLGDCTRFLGVFGAVKAALLFGVLALVCVVALPAKDVGVVAGDGVAAAAIEVTL